MAASNENVIGFKNVDFHYDFRKPILDEVSFNVRKGSKITIMGQNGAGKSTIFKLINGSLEKKGGVINIDSKHTIATGYQVVLPEDKELTISDFFRKYFNDDSVFNIDKQIFEVLKVVNLKAPLDKQIKAFSGGQQARLLLAAALIQDPDILLLDEPTNNLDTDGIWHLTAFLQNYKKTVLVISHDAEFLNSFTDGVLYLDVFTKQVEQFVGDYHSVVEQIKRNMEKENMANARLKKEAQAKKDQANTFAHKGGKLRLVAKKMREAAADMEDDMVDSRKEDKAIKDFTIPLQKGIGGVLLDIHSVHIIRDDEVVVEDVEYQLRKDDHMLLAGPNGIGKSTLLEKIVNSDETGCSLTEGIKIGYYRQDFSNLDFDQTVYECLKEACVDDIIEQDMRSKAAGFLINGEIMKTRIGDLSEGQKGLVAFCRLVFLQPGILILDEPTNHINFRHIPIIAKALDAFEGGMILVSHVDEFVWQIRIDQYLDLK
ncbi:ABC-F family ATP-binding cassette domain-containing protein [Candidatus Gracilibacteria bacterium 28_42_T64]|nr:ABC-F family ATP-binding cassette domain-containing protein [Candidatus Gracilibacteria bacterium 28_42_T64]